MTTALATIENVLINGDLTRLSPQDRVLYYNRVCESVGLNPLTKPFDYISLQGKLTLYAKKDATDQLRKLNAISIERIDKEIVSDLYVVTAYAHDKHNRSDSDIGCVNIKGLQGEKLANAMMKAVTKAKRRVTLSLSGLGWLDGTLETIPGAQIIEHEPQVQQIQQRCMSATRAADLFGNIDNMVDYVAWLKSITQAWKSEHDAISWAKAQGVFGRGPHTQNSYDKLIREKFAEVDPIANQDELFLAWAHKVKLKAKQETEHRSTHTQHFGLAAIAEQSEYMEVIVN